MSIAANAAASVVWLTADTTPTAGLVSTFAVGLTALLAAFDSDFLFVTGTFDCEEAALAAAFGRDFAFDNVAVALVPAFGAALVVTFEAALPEDFSAATAGFTTLVLPSGFAAAAFFTTGFAADLDEVALAAAGLVFFALEVGIFAGFFIAFAMESTTN